MSIIIIHHHLPPVVLYVICWLPSGKGKTRAQDAAVSAIESPLLDFPIKQAKGIVFNICGGPDLTLTEVR